LIFRTVLLPGILIPGLTTALVLALLRLFPRSSGRGLAGGSVAAGFVAAFVAISGWPRWPPVEATQRLSFLAAALVLLALLLARLESAGARLGAALVLAAVLLGGILQTPLQHTWTPLQSVLWLIGLAAWLLGLSWALGASFEHPVWNLGHSMVRLSVIGGIALSLGLSESFRLGQIAGAVACSLLVVEFATWLSPRYAWTASDGMVVTLIVGGMILVGYFFSSLEVWPAVLLSLAILLLALPNEERRWFVLTPLIPLALALALVITSYLSKEDDPYGEYYSSLRTDSSHSVPVSQGSPPRQGDRLDPPG
jgi:hypothetical protein